MLELSIILLTTFISSMFTLSIFSDNKLHSSSFLDNKNFIPGILITLNGMQLKLFFQELSWINIIICIIACLTALARIIEINTNK